MGAGLIAAEPSRDRSRREVLTGALLAATAVAAAALQPRTLVSAGVAGDVAGAIPRRIGEWSVVPSDVGITPPEDSALAAQAYDAMVSRTYAAPGQPSIMFVLAYAPSQSGTLIVHRPEICYPGAGFRITADRDVTIPLAPGIDPAGRFLSTRLGARVEQVLYWTRLGDAFPQSWEGAHLEVALQNLRGLVPDGALARLSVIDDDAAGSLDLLGRFAAAMFKASGHAGRALLAGPAFADRASALSSST